jgi:predicted porin
VLAVAASYKFSSFGVSLGYTQINFENVSGTDPSVSNILFSVFANLGPGVLFVNGYQTEFSDFAGARNDSGLQLGVTYRMPLSKRTDWYVAWGMNDYSGLQQTTASDIIDSQNRLAVGIRHLF